MNSSETSSTRSGCPRKSLFHTQLSSKTPEKLAQFPRRGRSANQGVVLSINEVRKVAESLNERSPSKSGRPKSARRKIESWPDESPVRKPKKPAGEPVRLPERYAILVEFFDSLDSSIRLLRLKGSATTFTNICPKIECLTDRRFSYSHLAQLKFILHEAIEIKKILVPDERTSSMKPDLHISINMDAIDNNGKSKSESASMHLRKVFRARLMDFSKSHPEVEEIPEETLPYPFNRPKLDVHSGMSNVSTSSFPVKTSIVALTNQQSGVSETCIPGDKIPEGIDQVLNSNKNEAPNCSLPRVISTEASTNHLPAVVSNLPPSFRKCFSGKVRSSEADNASQTLSKPHINKASSSEEINSPTAPSPAELSFEPSSNREDVALCASPARFPPCCPPATPSKELDTMNVEKVSPSEIAIINYTPVNLDSTPARLIPATSRKELDTTDTEKCSTPEIDSGNYTPAKLASTPARLRTVTPELHLPHPPKRCYMSPEDHSTGLSNKLVRRPPRSRSLKFDSPTKNENTVNEIDGAGGVSVGGDIFDILPKNVLQSIREKERKAMEERDPAISQAKRRQKMIAGLPKLFDMIHFLFQSTKQSVITKEELIHKIITNRFDIVDRREVLEQLNLLQELVPNWISEKLAFGGDSLFRINKASCPELIRARLEEAK